MGFVDYTVFEKQNKENMSNASGYDDDAYSYAGGCGVLHPFNKAKREECEKANLTAKTTEKQSDILLAQAIANKSEQAPEKQMGAGAIIGIVVASIVAITVMVVVIKKVKAKK